MRGVAHRACLVRRTRKVRTTAGFCDLTKAPFYETIAANLQTREVSKTDATDLSHAKPVMHRPHGPAGREILSEDRGNPIGPARYATCGATFFSAIAVHDRTATLGKLPPRG